ncbi:MAG: thiamine-phosphate kinase [Pseudomonadota bacterium]
MNEADFIAALRSLPLHPGAGYLRDDCAVLEIGNETLVLTHDSMAAGTHFRNDADPFDVAWKLVATNLSDLAAKGAEPVGVLLGYTLGSDDARFIEGLRAVLEEYDAPLLGGDTISGTTAQTHGVTAIGRATHVPVPDRGGAKAGDAVYVTGPLGCAMLGFEGDAPHLEAFNRPRPLLAEGQKLAPFVNAMMDISDGLALDCWRLSAASRGVGIELKSALIPVADQARFDECIRWGDDYQLLFTAHPAAKLPIPAIRIGAVTPAEDPALWLDDDILTPDHGLGFQHR